MPSGTDPTPFGIVFEGVAACARPRIAVQVAGSDGNILSEFCSTSDTATTAENSRFEPYNFRRRRQGNERVYSGTSLGRARARGKVRRNQVWN